MAHDEYCHCGMLMSDHTQLRGCMTPVSMGNPETIVPGPGELDKLLLEAHVEALKGDLVIEKEAHLSALNRNAELRAENERLQRVVAFAMKRYDAYVALEQKAEAIRAALERRCCTASIGCWRVATESNSSPRDGLPAYFRGPEM